MALSSAQIGATDNGYYIADRPTMLASPALVGPSTGVTRWNADGAIATADDSDSSYPVQAAYDGALSVFTRGAQAQQVWYFVSELAVYHRTVDAIFVHIQDVDSNHNVTMTIELSYDGSTWDSVDNISETLVDGALYRLFYPALQDSASDTGNDQRQWTGARYARIKFDATAGQTCRPQLNQVILGQQRQMPTNPHYPFDDLGDDSDNDIFKSRTGQHTIFHNYGGAKILDAKWRLGNSTDAAKASGLRSSMVYGSRPFVWCPVPLTSQSEAWLMVVRSPNKFRAPRIKALQWEFAIDAVEQGGSFLVDE